MRLARGMDPNHRSLYFGSGNDSFIRECTRNLQTLLLTLAQPGPLREMLEVRAKKRLENSELSQASASNAERGIDVDMSIGRDCGSKRRQSTKWKANVKLRTMRIRKSYLQKYGTVVEVSVS